LLDNRQKPIVFDFDDAIYLMEPFRPSAVANVDRTRFNYMLKTSRAVVISSAELSKVVQPYNSNIVRIPGPVDTERYESTPGRHKNSGEIIVGWIGSPSTAPYLEVLYDVFRKLTVKYPSLVISVIGSWPFEVEGVDLRVKQWSLESEVEDLSHFDIGIMPLPDNELTRGKGGYKLLQYLAMQIPCVASPVGINTEIIREGVNGFTAQLQSDWYNKLSLLIEDAELRQRMGREGRHIAEEEYSLHANVPKLINLFRSITR
jgi:glycosyltransferase involved in cell wall biosynthesis